jgi:hypothetical protein
MAAVKLTRFFNSHASDRLGAVYLATSAILIYGVEQIRCRLLLYLVAHNYHQHLNTKTRPQTANTFQVFLQKVKQEGMRSFLFCAPPRLWWEIAPFLENFPLHTLVKLAKFAFTLP